MKIKLKSQNKDVVFSDVEKYIQGCGLTIVNKDASRPWGGFFVIDEGQAFEFAKLFFPEIELSSLRITGKLSPKILLVEPGKRLSWQYHHRRAEIWRVISGEAAVATSLTDAEAEKQSLSEGELVRLSQGQRHRLIGLGQWGVIAEIWQHTDANHPSDEEDIVRVQDDFGR